MSLPRLNSISANIPSSSLTKGKYGDILLCQERIQSRTEELQCWASCAVLMLFTCWQTFGLLDNFDSQSIFRTNMSEPHGWRQRPAPGWVEPLSALWADLQKTRMSWRQLATSCYVTHFGRCESLGWAPLFTMTSGMFCSFLASFLTLTEL